MAKTSFAPLVGALLLPSLGLAQGELVEGELRVRINEYGVVTGVPEAGVCTLGARTELRPGFAEWYGVRCVGPDGPVDACGPGTEPDWGERSAVVATGFVGDEHRASATARAGDLEVRHDFAFDAAGPWLIVGVTLTNRGNSVLRDVVYTREVLPADRAQDGWYFPPDMPEAERAPRALQRVGWMTDDLRPGASRGLGWAYASIEQETSTPAGPVDVPLSLWTHPDYPTGLNLAVGIGMSFGDYDADGWIDIFVMQSGALWRNLDGQSWLEVANLLSVMCPVGLRYGSSFGDYDNDGLPDIATEPRSQACVHLLRNLGAGPNFVDVAPDPAIVDVQVCGAPGAKTDSETNCWADVDGDGDIDLFIPIYPPWAFSGRGNVFYRNLGPSGAGGAYQMQEYTTRGGFDNPPPDSARPEGAQFADVDDDGDPDLFSNGTLYQNNSSVGVPDMDWMVSTASGITFPGRLDEGAAFADYDMDGDYDLLVAYTNPVAGVRIWENHGDGTFFDAADVVDSPRIGLGLGMSIADWDGDGDQDFTTRDVFRRNMRIETGTRSYVVATSSVPPEHRSSAHPSWGDWDRDGDLDSAFNNGGTTESWFYENTTYDAGTPDSERRYVRVRPVRDAEGVERGVENEFAASVELRLRNHDESVVRRQFTSSSIGYLNQNEYALHFGLPSDPAPEDRDEDLRFDVVVDFPGAAAEGVRRVDKFVNAALGDVNLAALQEREIAVFRSGRVVLDGETFAPCPGESATLRAAGGGLIAADATAGIPAPVAAPGGEHWIGLDFDTVGAANQVRLKDVVLDGRLDLRDDCFDGGANVVLWDVTVSASPTVVATAAARTDERNWRSHVPFEVLLERDRRYRLVAAVDLLRESPFAGDPGGDLTVHGGLSFADADPCSGAAVSAAAVDAERLYLTTRFAQSTSAERYCTALPNSTGRPSLLELGGSTSAARNDLVLFARDLPPRKYGMLYYGEGRNEVPFGDGLRCIGMSRVFRLKPPVSITSDGVARMPVDLTQPPSTPGTIRPGDVWNFQLLYRDPAAGGAGFNLTDALALTFCP